VFSEEQFISLRMRGIVRRNISDITCFLRAVNKITWSFGIIARVISVTTVYFENFTIIYYYHTVI
jgi:hypothetical protein